MFIFYMTFFMGLVGVIGSYTASRILDKFGRKNQLFWTLLCYSVVMMLLGVLDRFGPKTKALNIVLGSLTLLQRLFFELG